MLNTIIDSYNGWSIKINPDHNMCADYSFDITDPDGKSQHVTMGGDDATCALSRAKEMIDMEIAMTEED